MNIKNLKVEKLHNQFSYDISFAGDNSLSIFTGPNGYGKTTMLQIIDNVAKGNFLYFYTFHFNKIEFEFADNVFLTIHVDKLQNDGESDDEILIKQIKFIYEDKSQNIKNSFVLRLNDIYKLIPMRYRKNMEIYSTNEQFVSFLMEYIAKNPDDRIYETIAKNQNQELFLFLLGNFRTFFIPAQRLYYFEKENAKSGRFGKKSSADEVSLSMKTQLEKSRIDYLENAQKHDNQFIHKYLSSTKKEYTEEEFRKESTELQLLINELYLYKLIDKITLLEYDPTHKKILSVYLDDLREKLEHYTAILKKLRIFSSILEEKMFANKKVYLSPDYGISASLEDGSDINLNALSSGEQNEIIMLYHLIFDVKDNTVLLIDEPEISLHVAWQLEFLDDIEKILEEKKIQVIIATHSPQIINEKWDLCFDFYANRK